MRQASQALNHSIDEEKYKDKMRSDNRALVLQVVDGTKPKTTTGLVDPRLFSGEEDNLRAIRDPQTSLWFIKYERGITPEPLRQKFTRFEDLVSFAEGYFNKRNLKIVEVKD